LLFAGVLEYVTNNKQVKINLGHVFFLSLVMAQLEKSYAAILFVIFAGFLPQVMVGNLDLKTLVMYPILILIVSVSGFLGWNTIVGIFLAMIFYGITFLVGKFAGETIPEMLTETLLPLFMNIVYFVSFVQVKNLIGLVIGA